MPEQDEVSLIEVISQFLKSNAGEHRGSIRVRNVSLHIVVPGIKGPGSIKLLQAQVLLLAFA